MTCNISPEAIQNSSEQPDEETDRQTDRQMDRQIEKIRRSPGFCRDKQSTKHDGQVVS